MMDGLDLDDRQCGECSKHPSSALPGVPRLEGITATEDYYRVNRSLHTATTSSNRFPTLCLASRR
jgi:hypothetical protein